MRRAATDNKAKRTAVADYRSSVRSNAYGLWSGRTELIDFVDGMISSIRRGFTRAWYEGAMACGILPSELTPDELSRLESEINTELQYVINYANRITAGAKGTGKLRDALSTLDLWTNRYENIRNLAMGYACGDQKLKWVRGPTRASCSHCRMLDGRVYRASVWQKSGWTPRGRDLECGGYKCLCSFQVTSEPASSGNPPLIGL